MSVDANVLVTAGFQPKSASTWLFSENVPANGTISGGQLDCGATCSAPQAKLSSVTLAATRKPGNIFSPT